MYSKSIDFKSLSVVQISSSFASGGIAVYMALTGLGVWSLVWRSVLNSVFEAFLLWFFSTWRPKFLFSWMHIKELLRFSTSLLGDRVLNYFTTHTDDLLIGKVLGSSPLGNYTKAYSLMQMPMTQISRVVSRVMFPSFSSIQDDTKRIASVYLKMTRVIALVVFPLMTGLFVLSEDFILLVFGPQWRGMVSLVQIFCILGMVKSIGTLVGNLYLSQGRADLQLRVGIYVKSLTVISIMIGLSWGVKGVAIAYTTACMIALYPEFYYAGRLVGLTWKDLIKSLISIFGISLSMGLCVYLFSHLTSNYMSGLLRLLLDIAFGIITYWFFIHILNIRAYNEVLSITGIQSKFLSKQR